MQAVVSFQPSGLAAAPAYVRDRHKAAHQRLSARWSADQSAVIPLTGRVMCAATRDAASADRIVLSASECDDFSSNRHHALTFILGHDLFRKPVPTPDP